MSRHAATSTVDTTHLSPRWQLANALRSRQARPGFGMRIAQLAAPLCCAVGTGHFVAPVQIRVARPRYSPTPQARRLIRMTFSGIYLLPQRRPGRGVGSRMIQMDTCGMEVASSSSRNRHALAPPFAGQLRKRHGPPRGSRSSSSIMQTNLPGEKKREGGRGGRQLAGPRSQGQRAWQKADGT